MIICDRCHPKMTADLPKAKRPQGVKRISSVIRRCFADVQMKYDWFIYKMAYNSIKRMCEKNPGMAYLMELNIKGWRENHPINDDLKHATEVFYDTMRRQNNVV